MHNQIHRISLLNFILLFVLLLCLVSGAWVLVRRGDVARAFSTKDSSPISDNSSELVLKSVSQEANVGPKPKALVKNQASDTVKLITKARDVNEPWLLMHGREFGKDVISYTFNLQITGKKVREYPYRGPYDRGINYLPPSEWLIYFVRPGDISISKTKSNRITLEYSSSGAEVPWFASEAKLWPGSMPASWRKMLSGTLKDYDRPITFDSVVEIDAKTFRVVSERMSTDKWKWWYECTYNYGVNSYPSSFKVTQNSSDAKRLPADSYMTAQCIMQNGYWLISKCTRYDKRKQVWTSWLDDITVAEISKG
jgi:hypothetical protein